MVTIAHLTDIPEFPHWTGRSLVRVDLYRCVLVSRAWYRVFLPSLWSSFGNRAAADPVHYQLEMYTKGTQQNTHHPHAPGMWDRFFYGMHLNADEPKFILATLIHHQRHVRHLYICSFQTLVAFCTASRTIAPASTSSSSVSSSSASSSSTTTTTTTTFTNLRTIESMHINLQPVLPPKADLERYRLMVWELVQGSPRLESLKLSGFPLPRSRAWFRSLLSVKQCLTNLDLTTQFQDEDFLEVADFLPRLQQLRVCLHRRETLARLAKDKDKDKDKDCHHHHYYDDHHHDHHEYNHPRYPSNSFRPRHTHLRRLSVRLMVHAGTVQATQVIRLLQAFPALQRLSLEDADMRRVEMVLGQDLQQQQQHCRCSNKRRSRDGSGGGGDTWGDGEVAQLIPWVPRLRVLREFRPGPLTMQALNMHCRDHFEGLEISIYHNQLVFAEDSFVPPTMAHMDPSDGGGGGGGVSSSSSSSSSPPFGSPFRRATMVWDMLFSFPRLRWIQAPRAMTLSFDELVDWVRQWYRRQEQHRCRRPNIPLYQSTSGDSHFGDNINGNSSSDNSSSDNNSNDNMINNSSSSGCWDTLEFFHCRLTGVPPALTAAIEEQRGIKGLVLKRGTSSRDDDSNSNNNNSHHMNRSGNDLANISVNDNKDYYHNDNNNTTTMYREEEEEEEEDNDDEEEEEGEEEVMAVSTTAVTLSKTMVSTRSHPRFPSRVLAGPCLITDLVFERRRGSRRRHGRLQQHHHQQQDQQHQQDQQDQQQQHQQHQQQQQRQQQQQQQQQLVQVEEPSFQFDVQLTTFGGGGHLVFVTRKV
ncbi:hypothetical protein DFQ27_008052 [Actinomortierella ambigua]|uniref:Uncharacterized protein n=1 Tax=Actinomortierella ambigua TaxID=1343610 RepID=A0A9P6QKV1_9FUNG|nr:hypothetical protein DFQ27_008052 [Actinomortierella ambigua]